jgi:hypothetical protein
MKKLLILTAIILFGFTSVNAQKDFQFGVKAGPNLSTISTDNDIICFESAIGVQFGVMAEVPLGEKMAFGPELGYKAANIDYCIEDYYLDDFPTVTSKAAAADDYSGTIKLRYLDIPLMLKYYVAEGFSLEAGPNVAFLLSAKDDWNDFGETGEDDIKDELKGIDFGVNFGLGYKLEGGLNFGARYNLGLSDANDNKEEIGDDYLKIRSFQVFVGYFF